MEQTKIEWCDATFNPWLIDDEGHVIMQQITWPSILILNSRASELRVRRKVFCGSLCDVFEDRPELVEPRLRLFNLIRQTPWLDWLLLTKRPENIQRLNTEARNIAKKTDKEAFLPQWTWLMGWVTGVEIPTNVWVGTSVESQEQADLRIPHLLKVRAHKRFLSCEPLLEAVDLHVPDEGKADMSGYGLAQVDWVIVGGESGPNARPMHPDWARQLRDQCVFAKVPFFFKQWGEYEPYTLAQDQSDLFDNTVRYLSDNNKEVVFDEKDAKYNFYLLKVGKKASGRILDGREWNEMPTN
jgi:protein gp37